MLDRWSAMFYWRGIESANFEMWRNEMRLLRARSFIYDPWELGPCFCGPINGYSVSFWTNFMLFR